MPTSRGQIKAKVWRFLNKSPRNPGYYSSEKLDEAIQEVLTFISVNMFLAGEGWSTSYKYIDTKAGQTAVPLPGDIALIREVRYFIGGVYVPVPYNDQEGDNSYIGTGVQQAFGYRYRLLGRQIVFDPPLAEGGERYLQIEAVNYPAEILSDSEIIDPQFDAACLEYLKYGVASVCAASIEKSIITWDKQQAEWWQLMQSVLNRRTMASTPLREFL
jgi:signal peptidase I